MFESVSTFWQVIFSVLYIIVSCAISLLASWLVIKLDRTNKEDPDLDMTRIATFMDDTEVHKEDISYLKTANTNNANDILQAQTLINTNTDDIVLLKSRSNDTTTLLNTTRSQSIKNTEDIQELKGENNNNRSDIVSLQIQGNNNTSDIVLLKSNAGDNSTAIASLQDKSQQLENDLITIKGDIVNLNSVVSNNSTSITSLQDQTQQLIVDTSNNSSSITSLQTQGNTNTSDITSLKSTSQTNTDNISNLQDTVTQNYNLLNGKISDANDRVFYTSTFVLDIGQLNRVDTTTYASTSSSSDIESHTIYNTIKNDNTRLQNTAINVVFGGSTSITSQSVSHSEDGIILYSYNSDISKYYFTYIDLSHFISVLGGTFDVATIQSAVYQNVSVVHVKLNVYNTNITLIVLCYSPGSLSNISPIPSSYYPAINSIVSNFYNKDDPKSLLLHITNIPTSDTAFYQNITYMYEPQPLSVQGDIVFSKVDYDVEKYLHVMNTTNTYGFAILKQEAFKYSKVSMPSGV
jgi:hypothetical protein